MAISGVAGGPGGLAWPGLGRVAGAGLAAGGAVAVLVVLGQLWPTAAVFWAFGLAFGFVLQRTRFCFAAAFRDLFLLQDGRVMKGVLAGMAVATPGFALVMYNLVPNLAAGQFAPNAAVTPVGPTTLIAGVVFGIGMVLAGGCMSGSLYRMGEGYVASWVTFVGILAGLFLSMVSWNWWYENVIAAQPVVWLPQVLGWTGAVLVTLVAIGAAYLLVLWIEHRSGLGFPEPREAPAYETLGEHLRSLGRRFFTLSWPAAVGGASLGVLNVLFYLFERPLGVTGELSRWSHELAGLGGLGHSALLGADLGPCGGIVAAVLATTQTFLVVGLVAGSLVAALLAGEFRLRLPRQRRRYPQSLAGGTLLGYGGGLGMGCTLGAFFSAVPSFGLNGWLFAAGLALGAFVGVRIIRRL